MTHGLAITSMIDERYVQVNSRAEHPVASNSAHLGYLGAARCTGNLSCQDLLYADLC